MLLWTEEITLTRQDPVPDTVYEAVRQQFPEEELVILTMAVVTISGRNRLAVAFRSVPGEYQPRQRVAAAK